MNFATLQGLAIPEGVVTQIADASGRVLWALSGGKVILEVEKITSDTYAGETTYTGEQFILLDIYPKTNGTVKVTYGGLTKTISDTSGAAEPNAQQVFFGTFNGVSDSVTTPASGELTIEGAYSNFAVGTYQSGSKTTNKGYCSCITNVLEWGNIENIANNAFRDCTALTLSELPSGITSIGNYAFYDCYELTLSSLPEGVTSVGDYAFYQENFTDAGYDFFETMTLPRTLTSIGGRAFSGTIATGAFSRWNNFRLLATTPPTGASVMFGGAVTFNSSYKSIIVPAGCGEAYKAAEDWSDYANYIVEAS